MSAIGWQRCGRVILLLALSVTAAVGAEAPVGWGNGILRQRPEWYASQHARAVAESVLMYQSVHGGWPKNTDLSVAPKPDQRIGRSTIDNGATTLPIEFLALVAEATGEARYRRAVERGIDYLLAAQYANGGWPQYFPLREGYYSRITYNDGAMINAMTLLRKASRGERPYTFLDQTRRDRMAVALSRGLQCILRTQIVQDGRRTAWCAQHDERTLEPAWGRSYEPPSLSGCESAGIVRYLMAIESSTPEVSAAIEGAVSWLSGVAIRDVRVEIFTNADGERDRRVVAAPGNGPVWARFYELGTNRPIFLGRDGVVHYTFAEIERERRVGYAYFGTWPARILDRSRLMP